MELGEQSLGFPYSPIGKSPPKTGVIKNAVRIKRLSGDCKIMGIREISSSNSCRRGLDYVGKNETEYDCRFD